MEWVGMESNQREVGYFHHSCTTIVQVATSCLSGWYYSSKGSQLDKTNDIFFFSPRSVAPSGTLKVSQQGQGFQINASLISLHLATEGCGVFHNRVLSFSYFGQPRGTAKSCIVLSPLEHPCPIISMVVSNADTASRGSIIQPCRTSPSSSFTF